ncbi:MAG: sigma-70 family RNA polymerase sigma factor [Bacilli bacterium]
MKEGLTSFDMGRLKPLTEEEMSNLFKRYKNGEDVRKELILGNIRLVINIVYNEFKYCLVDSEELISVGILGLIHSVDNYNLDSKMHFSTYSTHCIRGKILRYLKKEVRSIDDIRIYSYDDSLDVDYDFFDVPSNYSLEEDYETNKEIYRVMNCLDERERTILTMHYGLNGTKAYSQKEISEYFGLSTTRVNQIIKISLDKLNRGFNGEPVKKKVKYK